MLEVELFKLSKTLDFICWRRVEARILACEEKGPSIEVRPPLVQSTLQWLKSGQASEREPILPHHHRLITSITRIMSRMLLLHFTIHLVLPFWVFLVRLASNIVTTLNQRWDYLIII